MTSLAQLATACVRDQNGRPSAAPNEKQKTLLETIQSASLPAARKRTMIEKELSRLKFEQKVLTKALEEL
jgi:hypothetical protein